MIFLGLRINPRYFVRSTDSSDAFVLVKRNGDDLRMVPKDVQYDYIETSSLRLNLTDLYKIRKKFSNSRSMDLYVFETTTLMLLRTHQLKFVKVLEIGDLLYLNYRLKWLYEIWFLSRLNRYPNIKLVVTSEGFSSYLTQKGVQNQIEVIENIPRFKVELPDLKIINKQKFVLGYIGIFRYLENYRYVLSLLPDVLLSALYGKGVHEYNGLNYYGAFLKKDLNVIYEKIDLNFIYYSGENERLLTPNKFHESIVFLVPIIISSESWLASRVISEKLGIVMTGNFSLDRDNLINLLDNYNFYKQNLYEYRQRNRSLYRYSN